MNARYYNGEPGSWPSEHQVSDRQGRPETVRCVSCKAEIGMGGGTITGRGAACHRCYRRLTESHRRTA